MSDSPLPKRSPTEAAFALGATALEAGDPAGAESHFRRALEFSPGNPAVIHNLAFALNRLGRAAEAERYLLETLPNNPPPPTLMLLAEIYENTGHEGPAFRIYKTLLKSVPDYFPALMKLGALRERLGDKPGARECYRRAVEAKPDDIAAVDKYTSALWAQDAKASLALTEKLYASVGSDPVARNAVLNFLMCQKEWFERTERGLMPYHATHIDELHFKHAAAYLKDFEMANLDRLAVNPADAGATVGLAMARFSQRDRMGAEDLLAGIPHKVQGHILDAIRFKPQFYDELRRYGVDELTAGLPPLLAVTPPVPDPAGVLYLSCNFFYFTAFARPMLCSLREISPSTPVHLHIMDADEAETESVVTFCKALGLARFAVSVERPGLTKAPSAKARGYYHAVRFIRFYQHLELYQSPLWLMDVDALIHRDLRPMFAMLKDADAAMRVRPGRLEPWNQFNACVVAGTNTERSMKYFQLVAAYIAYFHRRDQLRWGIDQLAMYGAFADLQDRGEAPSLALLGEREIDYLFDDDSFLWCNSGAGKFRHLRRITDPGSMTIANFEDNKFVPLFEAYWQQASGISDAAKTTP